MMNNLDNLKYVEKIDSLAMRDILAGFAQQCEQAFNLGKEISLPDDFSSIGNIVFSGMGGSAIGAEIIKFYLREKIKTAIHVNRDYCLPVFVNQNSLVFLVSYSGNTEETLSAYQQANQRQAKIIAITAGGELADLAKKDKHPLLLIPKGFPPRGALAFLCFPVLAIFARMNLIAQQQKWVSQTVSLLEKMKTSSLNISVPEEGNPAKQLARRLVNTFCVIYAGAEHLSGVLSRWRGQFAENSKVLSASHVLPEMNHNEIVGWQHPEKILKRFTVLILRDKQDHPQVQKRIEISKEILQKQGIKIEEVWSQGDSLLARTFSLVYIGDYTSFYLAILNKEDPTPVKRIDYLKKRLKEWK